MLNFIRNRLRTVIGNRRHAKRYREFGNYILIARLSPVDMPESGAIGGVRDLSASGIKFEIEDYELGGHDLSIAGSPVHVVLALPTGAIRLKGETVRTVRRDKDERGRSNLLVVRIIELGREDRAQYREFIRLLE